MSLVHAWGVGPFALARELLVTHGALVEELGARPAADALGAPAAVEDGVAAALAGEFEAVLPPALAQRLGLPEHARFRDGGGGAGTIQLAYGAQATERIIGLATETPTVAAATLDEPLPRSSDPMGAALGHYSGLNAVLRPTDAPVAESWGGYLIVDYRYRADADERREGLLRVAVSEGSGAAVPALTALDDEARLGPSAGELDPIADPATLLRVVNRSARLAAHDAVQPLVAAVARRHARDRDRVRNYFDGLRGEMQAQLARLRRRPSADDELAAREQKITTLDRELQRKLDELEGRYRLRVTLEPFAALRLALRVRRVTLQLKRRQAVRSLVVQQSAATRTFDPLCCAACAASVHTFALCDDQLHILCPRCDGQRPSVRHCPACRAGSSRGS